MTFSEADKVVEMKQSVDKVIVYDAIGNGLFVVVRT